MSVEAGPGAPALELRPGEVAAVTAHGVESVEDAVRWAGTHRDRVRAWLLEHGALLVRGLDLRAAAAVGAVAARLTTVMAEREGFASRASLPGGVYSSSAWAPDMPMCMHHELSYARTFPATMLFACQAVAESGGEIELADAAAMAAALPPDLVDGFARDGWWLSRNYHPEAGTSWQDAFGTDDRDAVAAYCAANGIRHQWRDELVLRTWQRRPALLDHPTSGARCWFNQIAFLNEWTMEEAIRDYLVAEFGVEGLPFNTGRGAGQRLDASTVDVLNTTYTRHAVRVRWRPGDLLLVDNVRTAHSRLPFTGHREVVVAMGDPVDRAAADAEWAGSPEG
jgi:alpha-ketoglutarate-dependent taurine dioxygenase